MKRSPKCEGINAYANLALIYIYILDFHSVVSWQEPDLITLGSSYSKVRSKMEKRNIIQFYVGLVIALGSAAWTFFGTFNASHTVVLIIGIALIATSKYRLLK